MSYSIQEFQERNLDLFNQVRDIEKKRKYLDEISKAVKGKLLDVMLDAGIKSIDNDFIKIMVTKASESVSVDLKEFQKKRTSSVCRIIRRLSESYKTLWKFENYNKMILLTERLKEARKRKGLTQTEVAKMIFSDRQAVYLYESNRRIPRLDVIEKLAKIYGVNPAWLVGWSDEQWWAKKHSKTK